MYCNQHRRYLPQDHHFRGAHAAFDGVACHETAEEPLTGPQTIRRGYQSEAYIDGGGNEKDAEFPGKEQASREYPHCSSYHTGGLVIKTCSLFILCMHVNPNNMEHLWYSL